VVGETVRFDALRQPTGPYSQYPSVEVAGLASDAFEGFAADTTDSAGRAGVVVRMGVAAGPGGVAVTVPRLALVDTAAYTILPGRAVFVTAEPADTAVRVSGTFGLRTQVADRFWNPRPDPITFSSLDPAASVTTAGVVGGQVVGRGRIVARAGAAWDTSWVSVVPNGVFAATEWQGLVISNFDGSGRQVLPLAGSNGGYYPSWSSAANLIITSGSRITLVRYPSGNTEQILSPSDSGLVEEVWPAATRDGSRVYFAGTKDYAFMQVWRIAASGGTLERVSPDPNGDWYTWPAPSPDGSRVALVTSGSLGYLRLAVMQVGTGILTPVGGPALSPRWAPQSDRIAYIQDTSGELWVVDADGGNGRRISPPNRAYAVGLDWSPDEQWVVASALGSGIELVNVNTGAVLPLPGTYSLSQPAWRPN
jgi:Tol biopolymer transport system component